MSQLVPKNKGSIVAGADFGGTPGFVEIVPTVDGDVLTVDSTQPGGLKFAPAGSVASVDPRDIFRFSMIHNVGVTGGG